MRRTVRRFQERNGLNMTARFDQDPLQALLHAQPRLIFGRSRSGRIGSPVGVCKTNPLVSGLDGMNR
jgi:hypothetical protein